MTTPAERPNPGSNEARLAGCICPVIDNGYGRGARGTSGPDAVFWLRGDCPMHGTVEADHD